MVMDVVLDLMLLSAYLGFNAIVWIAIYGASRDGRSYERPSQHMGFIGLPRVSILVPLYMEKPESIMRTIMSISRQKYPRELFDVWLIVEEDDVDTIIGAKSALGYLARSGIRSHLYIVRGRRTSKARALNSVISAVDCDIVAIYDADDTFDENQLVNAIELIMSRGYDAVGVRVYRYRDSLLGRLLYIDTIIWYEVILSFLKRAGFHVPLSGEGLYIRKSVLKDLGGFPDRLAEDAYLSLLLFEKGYRVGLLDSYVEEIAPIGLSDHIRQRIRWYRGHLECLARIIFYSSGRRLRASISYLGPVIALVSLIASIISIFITASYIARGSTSGGMATGEDPYSGSTLLSLPQYYLLALILIEGIIPVLIVAIAILNHRGSRKGASLLPYVVIMPIYWIVISLASIPAIFFRDIEWYKTRR
jgi:cellulose synthase/poly-beta-1,6-N-acetylglucosamine synthase-like glycosyltransferase